MSEKAWADPEPALNTLRTTIWLPGAAFEALEAALDASMRFVDPKIEATHLLIWLPHPGRRIVVMREGT